ncbi:MAG: TetR family transcriptional regulator [Planctomycetes bacterium]|nr:TetR family transcriptional regulator [Planctomycetota bacterium]
MSTSDHTSIPAPPTKTRILDAAERLFASNGFRATSLRELTSAAEVNLAAVHYHFGSKEGLIRAVFARRLDPINRERLERLDTLELARRPGEPPVPLAGLIEAFVAPALELLGHPDGQAFPRLLGRLHSDPDRDKVRELLFEQFDELRRRFMPAFAAAAPHLDYTEICWRLHFVVGAMAHVMTCGDDLVWVSDGRIQNPTGREAIGRLVAFGAAGMLAAPPVR